MCSLAIYRSLILMQLFYCRTQLKKQKVTLTRGFNERKQRKSVLIATFWSRKVSFAAKQMKDYLHTLHVFRHIYALKHIILLFA